MKFELYMSVAILIWWFKTDKHYKAENFQFNVYKFLHQGLPLFFLIMQIRLTKNWNDHL